MISQALPGRCTSTGVFVQFTYRERFYSVEYVNTLNNVQYLVDADDPHSQRASGEAAVIVDTDR